MPCSAPIAGASLSPVANVEAISSVTTSMLDSLRAAFEPSRPALVEGEVTFTSLSSADFSSTGQTPTDTAISLYLYRVSVNEHVRNKHPVGAPARPPPLPLDLHYLLSVWASSASVEQALLAWAMRHLHSFPVLDRSRLTPAEGWRPDEVIHVAPEELTNEDLLRLWDTFEPRYRLSYSYVVRVVNIDPDQARDGVPVVARSLDVRAISSEEPLRSVIGGGIGD